MMPAVIMMRVIKVDVMEMVKTVEEVLWMVGAFTTVEITGPVEEVRDTITPHTSPQTKLHHLQLHLHLHLQYHHHHHQQHPTILHIPRHTRFMTPLLRWLTL
jgi:hypothetical protein